MEQPNTQNCPPPLLLNMVCLFVISHIKHDTYVFVHRFTHQLVHDELSELAAVAAVDDVCKADNNLQIVHVDVPIRMIGEQTERAMSVFLMCDTIII